MITVTINSRAFVQSMLNNDQFIQQKTQQLVRKVSTTMQKEIKFWTPVEYGRLRNSIRVYSGNGGMSAQIRTSVPYAVYVEYGTGIYAEGGGGRKTPWVYYHRRWGWTKTRGQRPKLFFRKGFNDVVNNLDNIAQGVFKWR